MANQEQPPTATMKSSQTATTKSAVLLSSMKVVLVELGSTMKLRSAMELGSAVRWRIGRDGSVAWDSDEDEDQR